MGHGGGGGVRTISSQMKRQDSASQSKSITRKLNPKDKNKGNYQPRNQRPTPSTINNNKNTNKSNENSKATSSRQP